jgi:uncharacterized protein (DUF1499 family)
METLFMKIVLVIVMLLMVPVIIVAATLVKNQAHFFETPGFAERLSVYLGQHTAATSDNHPFPELRTPEFSMEADDLLNVVVEAASELGWRLRQLDESSLTVSLVVTSTLFGFNDDLVAQVKLNNAGKSTLYIHSTSRKGSGDLAANAGHIQTLVQRVRKKTQ